MHDHAHGHAHHDVSSASRASGRLYIVLGITGGFMLVEGAAGLITGSLALLADAGHMLTDVIGLSLALLSINWGRRAATARKTYGYYRLEILAALLNALILLGVSLFILYEAYQRFMAPPELQGLPLLAVATGGLIVNIVGAGLLLQASRESLNVRGAFLELASDLLGSIGAIAAGLVLLLTGWPYADPIFATAIGLLILPRTWALMKASVDVLLEGTPAHIPLDRVREEIIDLPGIVGLHDLHVWEITSGFVAMSGHLVVQQGTDRDALLIEATRLLHDSFEIKHVTLQLETASIAEALQQPCIPGETACYTDTYELAASRSHH